MPLAQAAIARPSLLGRPFLAQPSFPAISRKATSRPLLPIKIPIKTGAALYARITAHLLPAPAPELRGRPSAVFGCGLEPLSAYSRLALRLAEFVVVSSIFLKFLGQTLLN